MMRLGVVPMVNRVPSHEGSGSMTIDLPYGSSLGDFLSMSARALNIPPEKIEGAYMRNGDRLSTLDGIRDNEVLYVNHRDLAPQQQQQQQQQEEEAQSYYAKPSQDLSAEQLVEQLRAQLQQKDQEIMFMRQFIQSKLDQQPPIFNPQQLPSGDQQQHAQQQPYNQQSHHQYPTDYQTQQYNQTDGNQFNPNLSEFGYDGFYDNCTQVWSGNEIYKQWSEKMNHGKKLLVFINPTSGGKQGSALLKKFKQYLNPNQIHDLKEDNGPEKGLSAHVQEFNNINVLACGGDGTGKWVLETLDKFGDAASNVAVGILPLGTGNDIGRLFGWGAGYSERDSLGEILQNLTDARVELIDRWHMVKQSLDAHTRLPLRTGQKEEPGVLNNYLSIGLDAKIAYNFHELRDQYPDIPNSRFFNKLCYLQFGLNSILADNVDLSKCLHIEVNGSMVPLKESFVGIVVINIPSYAGGTDLWGKNLESEFQPQRINDGLIEIVGIRSPFHMAQIQARLANAVRLAQGNNIKITLHDASKPVAFKIDGEPWKQDNPLEIDITYFKQSKMLCKADHYV